MPRFGSAGSAWCGRVHFMVHDLVRYLSECPDPPSAFEYAIRELTRERPKERQGRPRSPKANGPRLQQLRDEAGLTQRELIAAIVKRNQGDRFNVKTLQRYERSEAASPAILEVIAAMLSRKLGRAVTLEQLT